MKFPVIVKASEHSLSILSTRNQYGFAQVHLLMRLPCCSVFTGVFYFLSSTINPILYSVMSKRFRRAFRDKLCRPGTSCCLCLCCTEVVILGGGVTASAAGPGPARVRPGDSQSTTTRQRLLATYAAGPGGARNIHLASSLTNRPIRELSFAPGRFIHKSTSFFSFSFSLSNVHPLAFVLRFT